jgi:uncharacterized protein (TIGR02757 family)
MDLEIIKDLLEEKYLKYNNPDFIESDPVSIPRQYSQKNNIEISGFLTATIAWGQRPTIIKNAKRLIALMDDCPYDFIMEATEKDFLCFNRFCHRTFNNEDTVYFIKALANIYRKYGGLEGLFTIEFRKNSDIRECLNQFREVFYELPHPKHAEKHVADVSKGASAKRLNMFLRWMVRRDTKGVDFGLWEQIDPSALYIPLDIHTGNVARALGLLSRKQNDWKAVEELTTLLRSFDPADPVKYDFALFGMGVFEKDLKLF